MDKQTKLRPFANIKTPRLQKFPIPKESHGDDDDDDGRTNIPNEKEVIVDWLFELNQVGIKVKLHAISVTEQLFVDRRQNADNEEREQWRQYWRDVKEKRKRLDEKVVENVRQINYALETRIRLIKQCPTIQ